MTPWSSVLDPGNYVVTLLDTELTSDGKKYTFKGWQDQIPTLVNPRTIVLDAGQAVSLMAVYEEENPSTTTPASVTLPAGQHTIIMPATFVSGATTYYFDHWENGNTNPVRTVNLTADTTIKAFYTTTPTPPHPPLQAGFGILGLLGGIGLLYFATRKKKLKRRG